MGDQNERLVAVVTGGNKGLGNAIVKGLAGHGVTTILTARDEPRGLQALNSLKQEQELAGLVHFHKLDVTSPDSIDEFAEWLVSTFGGLNILINNAGISGVEQDLSQLENARAVMKTNYYGARRVTEKLIPFFKAGGRIVNVSSSSSRLDNLKNETLRDQLVNIDKLTRDSLDEIVESYLHDVENEQDLEGRWPEFFGIYHYPTSKVLLNAYSRLLAPELEKEKIFVMCMCPGLTNTSMTHAGHSPEVGADTAVWLALLPESEAARASGNFFIRRTEVGFLHIPYYSKELFGFSLEEHRSILLKELLNGSKS